MLSTATRNTVAQSYPGIHPVEAAAKKIGCSITEFLTNAAKDKQVPPHVADTQIEAFMHALNTDQDHMIIPFFSIAHVEAAFKSETLKASEPDKPVPKKRKKRDHPDLRRRCSVSRRN